MSVELTKEDFEKLHRVAHANHGDFERTALKAIQIGLAHLSLRFPHLRHRPHKET